MTANQLIEQVADILETHRSVGSGRYVIFANNSSLGFSKAAECPAGAREVVALLSRDVNEGPTLGQWRRTEDRIRILKREKVL